MVKCRPLRPLWTSQLLQVDRFVLSIVLW
jgi:hypothetical protein